MLLLLQYESSNLYIISYQFSNDHITLSLDYEIGDKTLAIMLNRRITSC